MGEDWRGVAGGTRHFLLVQVDVELVLAEQSVAVAAGRDLGEGGVALFFQLVQRVGIGVGAVAEHVQPILAALVRLVFGGVASGGVFAGDGVGSGRYGDVVIVGADVGAFRAAGRVGVDGPGRPDVLAEQVADRVTVRGVAGRDPDPV